MAAIQVEELTKSFAGTVVVDGLSFAVEAGAIAGFLGPNGAGKTTTLQMLLGLVTPDSGRALIDGRRYRELERPQRTVGAALESSGAHPGRTARNHLRIQALYCGAPADRIDEVLELVGLSRSADRRCGEFSLGMRQRLGLATALLGDPAVLVLDEPANGLDPQGVQWLRRLLHDEAAAGRAVLLSSHILAEVAQTVDSVIIVDRGRLVAHESLDRLGLADAEASRSSTDLEDVFLRLTSSSNGAPS